MRFLQKPGFFKFLYNSAVLIQHVVLYLYNSAYRLVSKLSWLDSLGFSIFVHIYIYVQFHPVLWLQNTLLHLYLRISLYELCVGYMAAN